MPVIKDKKTRRMPEEYTNDYLVVTWPVQKFLDEKGLLSADVIRQLDMQGKDYMYRWVRAGETPASFYKAMIAMYGMPESFTEQSLKIRPVSRHPLRIPGFRVEKQSKRYDEIYPDGRFVTSKLPAVPDRVFNTGTEATPAFRGTGFVPNQNSVRTRRNTVVTPPFSGLTVGNKDHAGMIALVRLSSVLKTERDGLLVTQADFLNQIGEKDARIAALESELLEANKMLDEALAAPPVPVMTKEERAEAEMTELTEAIKVVGDSGLMAELEKLRPKSRGLA